MFRDIALGDEHLLQIVELLCSSPSLNAAQIQVQLGLRYGVSISSATFYRRIDELLSRQIILRYRARFSLHPLWIERVLRCTTSLAKTYRASVCHFIPLPLREGELREFRAPSLSALDPIWNYIQLEVTSLLEGGEYRGFNSHAWYAVALTDSEQEVFRSMTERGVSVSLRYGNNTPLDRLGAELITVDGFSGQVTQKGMSSDSGLAVWASDQYVVQCRLPHHISKKLGSLFGRVKNPTSAETEKIRAILQEPAPCVLKVWKSRRRAKQVNEFLA